MAFKFNLASINTLPAGNTSNVQDYNDAQYGQGIVQGSDLVSNVPNSIMYKTAFALQYMKQFGGVMWQPNQTYKQNSIVQIPVANDGIYKIYTLKSKIDDNSRKPFTDGTLNKDENGFVYFTNSYNIDNTCYESVTYEHNIQKSINVSEWTADSWSTDRMFKFVRLIDFNQYGNRNVEGDFVITINRGGKQLMATVHVHSFGPNFTEVFVKDVLCNDYNWYRQSFGSSSPCKDIALLGCFLSLDSDKKLYLNINAKSSSQSGQIQVSTKFKNGNINIDPYETRKSYTFYNQLQNQIIPFINGANNAGVGCGQVYTYFYELSPEQIFRQGLLRCNSTSVNQWLYPNIQRVSGYNNMKDTNSRYFVDNRGSENYPASKLPNIKYYKDYGWRCNSTYRTSNRGGGSEDTFVGGGNSIIVDFDASRSSSIYTDGFNEVQPKSTSIFYYCKVW